MFKAIQLIVILLIVAVIGGGTWYVSNLKADLAISEENSKKLTDAISLQQETIAQMQKDQEAIAKANRQLSALVDQQNKELNNLEDKFNVNKDGSKRDFGKLAKEKPRLIEKAVNKGTVEAFRCIELASGAVAEDKEINSLCQSYIPDPVETK